MLTAIVGILLGNLLVANLFAPALQKLRDILEKFAQIELPFESAWTFDEKITTAAQKQARIESAATTFNLAFREYSIAFENFKKIGYVFVGSLVLLGCVVSWQATTALKTRALTMFALTAAIVLLAIFLRRGIAPSPNHLVSIDYLANNFPNLHLECLFDAAQVHVSFGRQLFSKETTLHFSLMQKMMFVGYRILFAITDEQCSVVYFVALGEIDSATRFNHLWSPELARFVVPLGDFPFVGPIKASEHLFLHAWLFVPTPRGWLQETRDQPRILSDEINVPNMGGGLRFHSGNFVWGRVDTHVEFERKHYWVFPRWKILQLGVPSKSSAQNVLRMYRKELERKQRLKSNLYREGREVKA